ncbi:MAG: hypothetical protein DRH08_05680 [Deltaproteobacteria bacterium]|nr:MAG: hypothetical protein DRH08_05680 [Deltaproteobacteria bacterium]
MSPTAIAKQALSDVQTYAARDLGYRPGQKGAPQKWGRVRYEEFTGLRAGRTFVAAIAFEDTGWSAITWAGKLQRILDPEYASVIFEPYNDFIITIYDERA